MTSTELNAFDEMRQLAKKTAALLRAAEDVHASPKSVRDDKRRAGRDDLAQLLGAALEAANATVEAADQLELVALAATSAAGDA